MDPDPHGSAFIFPPGSGSNRVNWSTKNRKSARKLLITASLLSFFKVNLHKFHCFLLLSRAVDPHSLYTDPDPDPAVFLNADPDPGPGPA